MKKILLDTNFLLIPYQFKVDIFSEIDRICQFQYKIYILDKTLKELDNIIKMQKRKHREAAKIALQLIKIKGIEVIRTDSPKRTDDVIASYGAEKGFLIATQDKDLKRKLVNQNVIVIVLRQKKFLAITNDKGFE